MTCRIADNKPLRKLTTDLALPHRCHSLRGHCIQSLQRKQGRYAMCSPGAVMGYCQGLFNRERGTPREHTANLIKWLEEIGAPHARSHELLWSLKRDNESPVDYIRSAMEPLLGNGRVPVIITSYDLSHDMPEIEGILDSSPRVYEGEAMLVRLALQSRSSIDAASEMINRLSDAAKQSRSIPPIWPLLQGDFSLSEWNRLRTLTGENWNYANVAVTPYAPEEVLDALTKQITVAQFLVGSSRGIHSDGTVTLHPGSCIRREHLNKSYNIFQYAEKLGQRGILPTSIICGPSLPEWGVSDNQERLTRYLGIYKQATKHLWAELNDSTRGEVLTLSA